MITIHLNEQPLDIDKNINILQLLQQTNSPMVGIAVAINATVISQSQWESTHLNHNDKVLIVQATQGG